MEDTKRSPLLSLIQKAEGYRTTETALQKGEGPVAAYGLSEPNKAHVAAALATGRPVLFLCATDNGAKDMAQAIACLNPDVALMLPRDIPLTNVMNVSAERAGERVHALTDLMAGKPGVTVLSMAAFMQRVAPKEAFRQSCAEVNTDDTLDPRELVDRLVTAGYERVELVEGRGQVAARGDLVDVYPPQSRWPVRIEFWGDTVDQMRLFDPVTQVSVEQCMHVLLPPAYEIPQPKEAMARALRLTKKDAGFETQREAWTEGVPCAGAEILLPLLYEKPETVLDYLPENGVLIAEEPARLEEAATAEELFFAEAVTAVLERGEGNKKQQQLELTAEKALSAIHSARTLYFYTLNRAHGRFRPKVTAQFLTRPATQYMGDTAELVRDLARWKKAREAVVLFAGEHMEPFAEQLRGAGADVVTAESLHRNPVRGEALIVGDPLVSGFEYPELHLVCLGATELFGKKAPAKRQTKKRNQLAFSDLTVGDYVVHEAHGIGRFTGVESLTVDGKTRDYLLLEYKGGDRLYIPTDQLDRVQKYIGGGEEDIVPPLSKLGGQDWANRVNKAKNSAKKLAVDLAALYAERASVKGYAFQKDTAWQVQLEERFPYTETPDQLESIKEIKQDMESPKPMDRLLCGDVGYGKTEVALRAAFKAVQDSKQVAFLVPTTILAQQHYRTLAARFTDFPVSVACLSRFQTPQERAKVKKQLTSGEVDIVVGTHALLAKDIKFKDLGLLIIDEEHRFGVNHKEQIKALRQHIDVLTLSATPIPRTLNLSMSGIRDISVIETPPEARYPVQTFVTEYSDGLLMDAVRRETGRGGQVYIVSNRVQSMESIAEHIRELMPEVSVLIGHGQMNEQLLEQTMLDFMEHRADVLLCSTIIESGLDIPNANTMIILEADRLGLAQLYQLRGRVGRGTRLGYAYLTVQRGHALNEKAQKRLTAIREFTQFGAGFRLAMRDMEIRGAGSLLGAEQSGHMLDVGYEYYLKIVQQAVKEAKGETVEPECDVTLNIPLDAHIPQEYVPGEIQRLAAYRRIAETDGVSAATELKEEFEDRYGEMPKCVENLFTLAVIKAYAKRARLASVSVKDGAAELKFAPEAQVDGGKLILTVAEMQGARLIATDPPGVRLERVRATAETLASELPQFLYKIAHCIDTAARI
ncbi:MAG: transcription-repair coupling factor [Clostridia bacterium]|nr:transcription-repair coupling factor [Clostridia bacterium]